MNLTEFWQQVYLHAIRSGKWSDVDVAKIADRATREFTQRHELVEVDEGVWDWRPKGPKEGE